MTAATNRRTWITRLCVVALAAGIWWSPIPGDLDPKAWHLFAVFVSAIVSVVIGAFPILTASILAMAAAVLTNTVTAEHAYAAGSWSLRHIRIQT